MTPDHLQGLPIYCQVCGWQFDEDFTGEERTSTVEGEPVNCLIFSCPSGHTMILVETEVFEAA